MPAHEMTVTSTSASARLDSLTSLRFAAAAMIVVLHARGMFGIPADFLAALPLSQGVSFFFVLSGFILTYVHPTLGSWDERRDFVAARIARIWPAHAAAFVTLVILLPPSLRDGGIGLGLLNLTMLHAWIPMQWSFYSFNGPSWSISTELFFYLCFPLLIQGFARTWRIKLALSIVVVLAIVVTLDRLGVPATTTDKKAVTTLGLVYVEPVVRLLEFILGMCVAIARSRVVGRLRIGPPAGTVLEAATLVVVFAALLALPRGVARLDVHTIGNAARTLLENSSCAPVFALLIGVSSLESGLLSRGLRWGPAVLLGEISYSIYLFHEVLIRIVEYKWPALSNGQVPLAWAIYGILLIVVAYLSWHFVEKPARRVVRNLLASPTGTRDAAGAGRRRIAGAPVALSALIVFAVSASLLSPPSAFDDRLDTGSTSASTLDFDSIQGRWEALGSRATILRGADGRIRVSNELDMTAEGRLSRNGLAVADWHVTARLSADGNTLIWSNGARWERAR